MTRKLCNIDLDSLCTDILFSSLYNSPSLDLSELCDQYDYVLSSILDKRAPLRKGVIIIWPRAPWYSEEIKDHSPAAFRYKHEIRTTDSSHQFKHFQI